MFVALWISRATKTVFHSENLLLKCKALPQPAQQQYPTSIRLYFVLLSLYFFLRNLSLYYVLNPRCFVVGHNSESDVCAGTCSDFLVQTKAHRTAVLTQICTDVLVPQRAARWTDTEWSLDVLTVVEAVAAVCDVVSTRHVCGPARSALSLFACSTAALLQHKTADILQHCEICRYDCSGHENGCSQECDAVYRRFR